MKKSNILSSGCSVVLLSLLILIGCSGGGGGGESDGGPSGLSGPTGPNLQIENGIATYDFGNVTVGNSPAPLELTYCNDGSEDLNVSAISLLDNTNFELLNSCNAPPLTIAPDDCCTGQITFTPIVSGPYDESFTITSNDSNSPHVVQLTGTGDELLSLNANLNQIQLACPDVKAFVSVTDQDDFVLTGLDETNFDLLDNVVGVQNITDVVFASEVSLPISVALVLDYSGSILNVSDAVATMEDAATTFVEALGASDEAEIIKFAVLVDVVQSFTTDKTLLTSAINNAWNNLGGTVLYDAAYKAVDDTGSRQTNRQAVIILTDGKDEDEFGNPVSTRTLGEVITLAQSNDVPIFTIGLGENIDDAVLQQMAEDTGGQYFKAPTAERLRTIYQQLTEILQNQYIITYSPGNQNGATVDLTVEVTLPGTTGDSDSKEFTACDL